MMKLTKITNVKKRVSKLFKKRRLEKLQKERLIERINEFLRRIKSPIPDFITMSGNLIQYKKWLAEPFLYINYIKYTEAPDKDRRKFFSIANSLMKSEEEYIELIDKIKTGEITE